MTNRYFLSHSPVNFYFAKNSRDFVVEEVPLYEFSGDGEHVVACVRKRDLTTWQLLNELSSRLGVKSSDIGYAGLKDKDALTIQHLSLPRIYESALQSFEHSQIKVLSTVRHTNKIKIGHLKGNKFTARLKKVTPADAMKLKKAIELLNANGLPNYFGYQRFGNDGQNHVAGREILEGKRKERNKKLKELFVNAYQSERFNSWLSFRVSLGHLCRAFDGSQLQKAVSELSKQHEIALDNSGIESIVSQITNQGQFLPLLKGDVMCHYPHGKLFLADQPKEESERFAAAQVCPTGALPGERTMRATDEAALIESVFWADIKAFGDRRYAWIWAENIKGRYIDEEAQFELSFYLPRGSYATVLLEELSQSSLAKLQVSSSSNTDE